MLYGPNTDFFNIVHLPAIVRHMNYTFLHCFSTYLQLEMAISVCMLILAHIFVCVCFSSIMGVVIWHARWAPFCHGEAFHWYGSKILFCSMYTSVCPKNIFFNIMNFVGIGSHMTFLFPSPYSIHFMYTCQYLSTCSYFYIFFCLRMVGIDCGWSDIAWQKKPSYFTTGYSDIFVR